MSYNSKNIKAAVKTFWCGGRSNLSEHACQKSCETYQNWGTYGQKETTYFEEALYLKHVVLITRIINIIINMDDIRQERTNERSTLKLNKRFKLNKRH